MPVTSNTDEWAVKLHDGLTELKILTSNVVSKIDQLTLSVDKLEKAFDELKDVSANQETRLTVLEERLSTCHTMIPKNLSEDFALMKAQLDGYRQFAWLLGTTVMGLVIKMIFDMVTM